MSTSLKQAIDAAKVRVSASFDAVGKKGGKIPTTKDLAALPSAIDSIPQNGGSHDDVEINEVNFVDFNGCFCSMTREEAMALTEMPTPPEYDFLTFDGWTNDLDFVKQGICLTIGALYRPTDGRDHFVVKIDDYHKSFTLKDCVQIKSIDWGDGTIETSFGYSASHVYSENRLYHVKVEDTARIYYIYDIYGENIVEAYYADINYNRSSYYRWFTSCKILSHSKDCVFNMNGNYTIGVLKRLKSLVLPNGVTGVLFNGAINVSSVVDLEYLVSNGATSIPNWTYLNRAVHLKALSLGGVTSIKGGDYQGNIPNLKSIYFGSLETTNANLVFAVWACYPNTVDLPASLTNIPHGFGQIQYNLYLRHTTPPTLAASNTLSLNTLCKVHVKADASYTDEDGNTYYGVEAYEHATNWAALTATNTFIADL